MKDILIILFFRHIALRFSWTSAVKECFCFLFFLFVMAKSASHGQMRSCGPQQQQTLQPPGPQQETLQPPGPQQQETLQLQPPSP